MEKTNEISLDTFAYMFEKNESSRRFCFILGSGASRDAGIPTGLNMARIWAAELTKKYEETELRELMKKLRVNSVEPTSENYFGIYELLFYPDYYDGHAFLERELEKGNPSLGHHALSLILAGGKHNLVITTNFDSLIEDALFIYTTKRPLVVGHEALTEFINLNITRPIIAKIHRSLYFQPLNRQKETDGLASEWEKTLRNAFMVYTPIVIGYGGGDQSLMKFLKDNSIEMKGLFWCYWNKEEPSEEIVKLVNSKNGCFVPIESFDQMMFMLSQKLDLKNPEDEIKRVAKERIERYNTQYEKFIKEMNEKSLDKKLNSTIQAISTYNDWLIELALIKSKKEPSFENYYSLGQLYNRMTRYTEAIEAFTKTIELMPDCAEAYYNRGRTYNSLQDYKKAIEDFNKTAELTPDYVEAYYNRGYAFHGLQNYEKAIEDFSKVIELEPDYSAAYNHRGYTYYNLQDYEKAIEDLSKAIELTPDYANAYKHLGEAYYQQKEYEKALECLGQAIQNKLNYKTAFELRAKVYRKLGEVEKAKEDEMTAQSLERSTLFIEA